MLEAIPNDDIVLSSSQFLPKRKVGLNATQVTLQDEGNQPQPLVAAAGFYSNVQVLRGSILVGVVVGYLFE